MADREAQRLFDAFGQGLKTYLMAEKAIVEHKGPMTSELIYEWHDAAERFVTLRQVLRRSIAVTDAMQVPGGDQT